MLNLINFQESQYSLGPLFSLKLNKNISSFVEHLYSLFTGWE